MVNTTSQQKMNELYEYLLNEAKKDPTIIIIDSNDYHVVINDDGTITKTPITEEEYKSLIPEDGKNVIPGITPRQARLYLLSREFPDSQYPNMLAYVENRIENLPEPDRTAAKISWEYAISINRNDPFVATLGNLLGLDEQQLDEVFFEASKL